VAKAKKPKRGSVQHTWKVVRTNNNSVNVSAEGLTVVDGDLVFSTKGVPVRVIGADTYTDVELMSALEA
jgi:hypothetical protein